MIKAICFDLDGVYFKSSGFKAFKDELVALGAPRDKVEYYLHDSPMMDFKKGITKEFDFWKNAIEQFGINITVDDIKELLAKGYAVDEGVKSLVIGARNKGYKTCVCSNNFITRVEQLDKKFNFLKDFDVTLFSYEIGELKPSELVFKELLSRADVKPRELVYSDDNESKLKGAKEIGIKTFVFTDTLQFKKELENLGVII